MRAFVVLLFLASCTEVAKKKGTAVVILSIDGAKPAVLIQAKTPVLKSLAADGAATWNAQTVDPSLTLPSHVSMLTGLPPSKHKILWNYWMKENGPLDVPTIFSVAKGAKLKTAFFATKEKFRQFELPDFYDIFSTSSFPAVTLVQTFLTYYQSENPDLSFLHFYEIDEKGHKHGWGSKEQLSAFEKIDMAVGMLIAGLSKVPRDYVIIITADHGGHEKSHGTTSPEDMTIPWIAWGSKVKKNHTLQGSISTMDTAATALYLLGVETPKDWQGKAVQDAFLAK